MTAQLIDGKAIAANVRQRVAEKITARQQAGARAPGLAVVVVGEDPASHVYVSNKHRACEQAGILSFQHALPADTTQEALEALVDELNNDATVDGILVQLPCPPTSTLGQFWNASALTKMSMVFTLTTLAAWPSAYLHYAPVRQKAL